MSNDMCEVCNKNESEWVCVECGKYLCNDCKVKCEVCRDIFCPDCIKTYNTYHTYVCDTCRDINKHKFVTNNLKIDSMHNMLADKRLIQSLSKRVVVKCIVFVRLVKIKVKHVIKNK